MERRGAFACHGWSGMCCAQLHWRVFDRVHARAWFAVFVSSVGPRVHVSRTRRRLMRCGCLALMGRSSRDACDGERPSLGAEILVGLCPAARPILALACICAHANTLCQGNTTLLIIVTHVRHLGARTHCAAGAYRAQWQLRNTHALSPSLNHNVRNQSSLKQHVLTISLCKQGYYFLIYTYDHHTFAVCSQSRRDD